MPDDILDAAQKSNPAPNGAGQINDAAQLLTPPPPAVPLPPPSPLPSAPLIPAEKPPEVPPPPTPTPPVTPPAAPTPTESALIDTIIHESESAKTPPPATPPEPPAPPVTPFTPSLTGPSKKKGSGKGFVTAILFLLLLTVPIAVYYISQTKQLADIRNRAALVCGGYPPITCSNGSQACNLSQCPAPTPIPGGACPGLGGLGQVCRVPQNCNNLPNCDGNLICLNGTCQTPSAGQCGSTNRCRIHICDKCSDYGGGLSECRSGGQEADCSSAVVPAGQCGQIDILDTQGNYCGVKQQACTGSCAGGPAPTTPPPGGTPQPTPQPTTPPPGPTATPTPVVLQCTRIRVYKNNVQVDPTILLPGDAVVLAVAGQNATKGRIRVNGSVWTESTTLNSSSEYTAPFTVPTDTTSFTVEAEVFKDGVWQ